MNKSVKKIIVTSASLLMMASIGVGVGNLSRPVHAESNSEIAESLRKQGASSGYVGGATPEQKRDEARATAWANKVDMNEDIRAHESEGMTRSQAVASIKKFNKEKQAQMKKAVAKADHRTIKTRNRRTNKRADKRAIKGIDASRYTRALRKSNYVLRHGRRHAKRYIYREAKKFTKANNAEKKAYRKFARKHTNRNRKAVNKAITNLNNLVNALLK